MRRFTGGWMNSWGRMNTECAIVNCATIWRETGRWLNRRTILRWDSFEDYEVAEIINETILQRMSMSGTS